MAKTLLRQQGGGATPLCPAVPTPQSEPLNEQQVPNSAGGHAYPVDDMTRLRRFLILGSEGGSYYASERKLTLENAAAVKRCIQQQGLAAIGEIIKISQSRRAPKVGPPLFALAMASTYGDEETRKFALHYLPKVARTGSHLQMFVDYITSMRGWGRGLRRAVAEWYTKKDINVAVYQAVKYRQRYNWTHRDLLRKAHPKAASSVFNDFFAWVTHGTMPPDDNPGLSLIRAYEQAKTASVTELFALIEEHQMTWEMVPSEMLDKKLVWAALANHMPTAALVRNLATLTRLGVIAPMESAWVCQRLNDIGNRMTEGYSIIHPINVFTTSELSLHRCPAVKARRMATPSNSCHSAHGS
jgi:60 kDa SS-A/Ro ribonucleoprotein